MISKHYREIGSIFGMNASHAIPRLERMRGAPAGMMLLLGLIERVEKHNKKGQIIGEADAVRRTISLLDGVTKATIQSLITFFLVLAHVREADGYMAKHGWSLTSLAGV
jgi:hypothetical protein